MELWAARDNEIDGLYLYNEKPFRAGDFGGNPNGWGCNYKARIMRLPKDLFPELTWQDEPIQVELKRKEL